VDNAIRACVDRTVPESTLTEQERKLLISICGVASINKHVKRAPDVKDEDEASKAAAFAAGAAADTVAQQYPSVHPTGTASPAPTQENSEPHRFTPNMTGASPATPTAAAPPTVAPAPPMAPSHRPSVEPITPVPGSPAVQNGTPMRRPMTELTADSTPGTEEAKKLENSQDASKKNE
jgi:hypothetical protein